MSNPNEKSGNTLDAAPKGPRLPGKKKMPPMPKQEPAAAPATTPAPAPETPVSAVREIKEIGSTEKMPVAEVLAEMEKQGFKPAIFTPDTAAETPTVEATPAPAPTVASTGTPAEDPAEVERQRRLKFDHLEAAVVVAKHNKEEKLETPTSTYETVRKVIETTHQSSTETYEEMRKRIDAEPLAAAQLAEAVNEYTEEMRKQREAGNLLPIASDPVIELTLEAPPPSPEEPPTRLKSANTLLPEAEAIAENKDEAVFFSRGDKMGQRSALRPRLRRTVINHNHVTIQQPQENEMSRSSNVTSATAAAPAATPTAETAPTTAPETTPPATETPAAAKPEEEKHHAYGWWAALVAVGLMAFLIGHCTGSIMKSDETKVAADTTATATHTASAKPSATPTTSAVAPASTAKKATETTSSEPVSVKTAPGTYTPTNALLVEVASANGDKWSGTVDCFKTDWTPVDDTTPWIDCSGQEKKAITGPQPDCFKVADCKVVVP